jgi:Protein of unknown function (DUF998)
MARSPGEQQGIAVARPGQASWARRARRHTRPAGGRPGHSPPARPCPRARQRRVMPRRVRRPRRSPAVAAGWGAPWWGVVSSAAAPLLLVAGGTAAALLQPRSFDAVSGTVSALAAVGAADRWVMTLAFALAGACEVVTGLALRSAGPPGRLILMVGGAAGVLVAANPEHAGGSLTHAFWAGVGFAALVAWPGGAWRRGPSVPWGLRPTVSAGAAATLLALLAWFLLDLVTGGGQAGLAERVMGVTQAAWPLAVVLSCRWQIHDGPDATGCSYRHWHHSTRVSAARVDERPGRTRRTPLMAKARRRGFRGDRDRTWTGPYQPGSAVG